MSLIFKSKAESLAQLENRLKNAIVLPQVSFNVAQWKSDKQKIIKQIASQSWGQSHMIVRSSAIAEDNCKKSLAGHYYSELNVFGEMQLQDAVDRVIETIGKDCSENRVFIQPLIKDAQVCGVAFTRDPNTGSHYDVINYDDISGKTDAVTSGESNELKIIYNFKKNDGTRIDHKCARLFPLLRELEELFNNDSLDLEFAIKDDKIYLFQVRPLNILTKCSIDQKQHFEILSQISKKIRLSNRPHPYLHGSKTVYGVMPDWNPAEIIGIRPHPLALSLYKDLITDNIWAYQRNNYGYRNLRSFPLLISFAGLPYIDVRVSFNSFIPADIDDELAEKIANYYINRLLESPGNHDKVEFEIIFSCYTLDIREKLASLSGHNFTSKEMTLLTDSLLRLTNNIIHREEGLWNQDIEKINMLVERQNIIKKSNITPIEKIYWLLEDCKRYGTLPFAGLARAAFIAVQLLKSIVNVGIMKEEEYQLYLQSLNTISSRMSFDFINLGKSAFLEKYGHLRPGTYDILSTRYDETPERYFDWNANSNENIPQEKDKSFSISIEQLNHLDSQLKKHKIEHDVLSLFRFIKGAIEGREYAKFAFSRSLSDAMSILIKFAQELGFTREDVSFADINVIKNLYANSDNSHSVIKQSIEEGKQKYNITKNITLPPLISCQEDVFFFELPKADPNFITMKKVRGKVVAGTDKNSRLNGNILMLPIADPGYDWIFSQGVAGFITMYGGINSHMAIRASELGIPAVIGTGEPLYSQLAAAKFLELDCAKKQVRILR